jgi:hypothetical protein
LLPSSPSGLPPTADKLLCSCCCSHLHRTSHTWSCTRYPGPTTPWSSWRVELYSVVHTIMIITEVMTSRHGVRGWEVYTQESTAVDRSLLLYATYMRTLMCGYIPRFLGLVGWDQGRVWPQDFRFHYDVICYKRTHVVDAVSLCTQTHTDADADADGHTSKHTLRSLSCQLRSLSCQT